MDEPGACDIAGVSFISAEEAERLFFGKQDSLCVPCHFHNNPECVAHNCRGGIYIHPVTITIRRLQGII